MHRCIVLLLAVTALFACTLFMLRFSPSDPGPIEGDQ